MSFRRLATLCLFVLLGGCSDAARTASAHDAATDASVHDASGRDGSTAGGGHDAGPQRDAGSPRDAGADGATDAAADGGVDAGVDAGSPDNDAGSELDAGEHETGDPEQIPIGCRAPEPVPDILRACPDHHPVPLELTEIADYQYGNAVFLTHSPNDPENRLFVVLQSGQIMIIEDGKTLTTPFLDLSSLVQLGDGFTELGLLGMAFDPDYEVTGRFWVNYTAPALGVGQIQTIVESYRVSSDPDVADPTTQTPLLAFDQPEENHNGGMLAFGPDGCLYIGSGDGGGFGGDAHASLECPDGNGQCLETELGKILRVDVDHPDTAAPGNIVGAGVPHIWDYGLRNPWRFSFDRKLGDLYIADVGQDGWEELDIAPVGVGGHNYGWRVREGKHDNALWPVPLDDAGVEIDVNELAEPVYDYPHVHNDACVIGGYVYRGGRIPSLRGYYVFADFMSARVSAVAWDGSDLCGPPIDLSAQLYAYGGVASFGEDADGELYVITGAGKIARIDPR